MSHDRTARDWGLGAWMLAAALAVATLAGCNSTTPDPSPTRGSTTHSASPASASAGSPAEERVAVEAAYRAFWPAIAGFRTRPPAQWKTTLAMVAADPQLSFAVAAAQQQRRIGITSYGQAVPREPTVTLDSPRKASLRDCVDFSHTGQAEIATGRKRTAGIAATPLAAVAVMGSDQRWRISQVSFPGGTCQP